MKTKYIKQDCPKCPNIHSMILMANDICKCQSCLNKYNVIKDPLDEIFVDYHKSIIKEKFGQWEFKKIGSEFLNWLNCWADFDKHKECLDSRSTIGKDKRPNHITEYGRGYNEAIRDICKALKMNWRLLDKRTKTGFKRGI